MKPFLRTEHNYDMHEESKKSGLECPEPTLTQQSFAEEADINFIADRYGLTGEIPQVLNMPKYGDYTGIFDFQTAQNSVRQALEQFMTLPARLRSRFDNDPQKLLTFIEDETNRPEAEFLGLVKKEVKPETLPTPETTPKEPQPLK